MWRLAAVREAVGDDVEIFIDANNGYYAKQAIYMARKFERYNVGWFEEPVLADDIEGLVAVAKAIDLPVATGEHEYTKYGFKDLLARGGADIAQPDVGRAGGITEWMKVAHLAHAFNCRWRPTPINSSTCISAAPFPICALWNIWASPRRRIRLCLPSLLRPKMACGRRMPTSMGWVWNWIQQRLRLMLFRNEEHPN
ncbi:MAG: enolase C-terminal domain-like protein [Caldilineaceae bacterium]